MMNDELEDASHQVFVKEQQEPDQTTTTTDNMNCKGKVSKSLNSMIHSSIM
jgi:hypothetical protein